jgi:hypothetical protein
MSDTEPIASDSTLEVEVIKTSEDGEPQQLKAKVPDTGFIPLQDFMGIAHPDEEQKDKLQHIWEYYQKGRDRAETIEEIKKSMHKLGAPPLGEDQLHRLYAYTRLQNESRSINKELRAYENESTN